MDKKIINLEAGHEDFVLAPGVRGTIVWHGQDYDLKKIQLEVAERMAREDATRYVRFSDARMAREAAERTAALLPPKPAAAPKEAPATAAPATGGAPGGRKDRGAGSAQGTGGDEK